MCLSGPQGQVAARENRSRKQTVSIINSQSSAVDACPWEQRNSTVFLRSAHSPVPHGTYSKWSLLSSHRWPPGLHSPSEHDPTLSLEREDILSERTTSSSFCSLYLSASCPLGTEALIPPLGQRNFHPCVGIYLLSFSQEWYSLLFITGMLIVCLSPAHFPLYQSPCQTLPFKQSNPPLLLHVPQIASLSVSSPSWAESQHSSAYLFAFSTVPSLLGWLPPACGHHHSTETAFTRIPEDLCVARSRGHLLKSSYGVFLWYKLNMITVESLK